MLFKIEATKNLESLENGNLETKYKNAYAKQFLILNKHL